MVFSSTIFLNIFLPLLLAVYFLSQKRFHNAILLAGSLLFYGWGEPKAVFLMLAMIVFSWGIGLCIEKSGSRAVMRKFWLSLGICGILALLVYFKYMIFSLSVLRQLFRWETAFNPAVVLPVGISFYSFQMISYFVDVYRNDASSERNPFRFALYISMFPQLVAGPIVRYQTVSAALLHRRETLDDAVKGLQRFAVGLAKKVLIADRMAIIADRIWGTPLCELTAPAAWLGCLAYTLQIFYDFSAYSDMAIGLARVFGFRLPENFTHPYSSGSMREFWRRWHISLSTWLRDYLYIPLGGSRSGGARTVCNLFFVFLICGLWHGAGWTFIVWGLWHGFALFIERCIGEKRMACIPKPVGNITVWLYVMIGWVIFRSSGMLEALAFLKVMFVGNPLAELCDCSVLPELISISGIGVMLFGIFLSYPWFNEHFWQKKKDAFFGLLLTAVLWLLSWIVTSANSFNPFIYFRF